MANEFGRAPGRIDFVLYAAWIAGVTALNSDVETDFGKCVLIVASTGVPLGLWLLRGVAAIGGGIEPPRARREKWAWHD